MMGLRVRSLAVAILLGVFTMATNAWPQPPGRIDATAGSASANPGSTVQIPITISVEGGSKPVASGTLRVEIRDSGGQLSQKAMLVGAALGPALPSTPDMLGSNPDLFNPPQGFAGTNSALISFAYFSSTPSISSGVLLTVTVSTQNTSPGEIYTINLPTFQLEDEEGNPYQSSTTSGTLTIISTTPTVAVTPTSASVRPGRTQTFTAVTSNLTPSTVQWEVVGGASNGTVSPQVTESGQSTTYTAPAFTTERTVVLKAISTADPTKWAEASITLKPPIQVVVSPQNPVIRQGTTLQFQATVQNVQPGQDSVTWSIADDDGTKGSISQTGLYTPPTAPIPDGQQKVVTIRATNTAEGIETIGTTTVTVKPEVRVVITGPSEILQTGRIIRRQSVVFSGTAVNADNPAVTWSATSGTINPSTGAYTAPDQVPSPPSVTIRATSVEDPSKYAELILTVESGNVVVSPATATVTLGRQLATPFTATVDGVPASVTWSADFGSITANGVYTAPSVMPPGGQAIVKATDPRTGLFGTAVVTLQDVLITLVPDAGMAKIRGGRSFTITAVVENTDDKQVSWTAVNTANNQPFGTITPTTNGQPATYTAPPIGSFSSPVQVRVTATTRDLGRTASLEFTVRPGISVSVSGPAKINVDAPSPAQFSASVAGIMPGEDADVVWSVSPDPGGGSISSDGKYSPSGVSAPRDVTITAVSKQAISEVGSAAAERGTAVIGVLPPVSTEISVVEGRTHVAKGGTLHFTATVRNFINTSAVSWSVAPVNPADNPGTIDQNGTYTAPADVDHDYQVVVTATPADDPRPGHEASITITVKRVQVTVTPERNWVRVGKTVRLRAEAVGVDQPNFVWTVVSGGGTVSPTTGSEVTYTAPAAKTADSAVISASVEGVSGTAEVELRDKVLIQIAPSTATARIGGNQITFTANTANWRQGDPPIVWKVNGVAGGNPTIGTITQEGIYTPPAEMPQTSTLTISAESTEDPSWKGTAVLTLIPRPRITSIHPSVASQRGVLEIEGTNLGAGGTVTINGISSGIEVQLWSETRIRVVQPGTLSGPVKVMVDGSASNDDMVFRIVPGIQSIDINPSSPTIGLGERIRFTAVVKDSQGNEVKDITIVWKAEPDPSDPGSGTISQDGLFTPADVGKVIITASPLGREEERKTGRTTVTVVRPPIVLSISPAVAPVGTEVAISGSYFGSSQGDSTVKIGGVPALVKSWSPGLITATVAPNTPSGPVVVTVRGADSNNTVNFTVISSISITPKTAEVVEGTSAVFSAVGNDPDGNIIPGLNVEWSVAPVQDGAGQASIDSSGLMKAISAGSVIVTAKYLGLTSSASVTIAPKPAEEAPNFAFLPPLLFSTGSGTSPRWLNLVDVDRDGWLDAVVTDRSGSLIVLPGKPGGTFGAPVITGIDGTPMGAVPYDVDGNKQLDMAVAEFANSKLLLLTQGANLEFQVAKSLPEGVETAVGGTYDVAVGDFNGDGLSDLAVTDMLVGNRVRLFIKQPDGSYSVEAYPVGRHPVSLAAADLNGDGKSDLAVATLVPGTLVILLSDASAHPGSRFLTPVRIPTGLLAYSVTATDLNADGNIDLVVADPASNQISIISNLGGGVFSAPVTYPTGRTPRASAVGDFNMDGKIDIAVANEGSQSVSILPGNGSAGRKFGFGSEISAGGAPTDIAVGDVNKDGKPDLVVLLTDSSAVGVLLNTSTPPIVAEPDLRIIAPVTGEIIEGTTVRVRVEVRNLKLVDFAQKPKNAPGEGHIHMWLDTDPSDQSKAIEVVTPEDVVFTNVPYGTHTLTVEVRNNDHSPLSPPLIRTVRFVTVPSTRK